MDTPRCLATGCVHLGIFFQQYALVIFGGYRAGRCLIGALLFGMIDALQLRLQGLGFDIPYQFFLLLPYLITLIALILVARKAIYPAAFLEPYRREE
jgi:simple sugar transport system permease protein